jgi:hypothetical protein
MVRSWRDSEASSTLNDVRRSSQKQTQTRITPRVYDFTATG